MIELNDVLTIVAIIIGLFAQAVGVMRWMNAKIDEKHTEYHRRISDTNNRIQNVRDEYVKRVDLDRDLTNIHMTLGSIKDDIRGQTDAINIRLDKLLGILASKKD